MGPAVDLHPELDLLAGRDRRQEHGPPVPAQLDHDPLVLALLGTNAGALLSAGLVDARDVEEFVRSDEAGGKEDDERSRPWLAASPETFVGQAACADADDPDAVPGFFPEPAVWLARDVVFTYSD